MLPIGITITVCFFTQTNTEIIGYHTMKSDTCDICGGRKSKFLFSSKDRMCHIPGNFRVMRCLSCGVWYLRPKLAKKILSRYYPSQTYYAYTEGKKGFFGILREFLIAHRFFLFPSVPAMPGGTKKPGRILDVGCGTGESLISLQKLGWEGYGLDRDKKALAVATKRGVRHIRYGSYKDISRYPNNFFDVVRLYHVIEHLDDPALCLRLIRKKLKQSGQLLLGTPNAASFASRIFGTYWYNLDSPRHLFVFSPRILRKLCEEAGFLVAEVAFCSAGGIIGSVQYLLEDKLNRRINLIHTVGWVLATYPLERIMDWFGRGDVFTIRAT